MCWFPRGRIMPFVLRKVEPRYLCRGHVPTGSAPQGWPVGAELEAVANGALTVSLKQLASLLTTAENIFADLTAELTAVADRSSRLRQRIDKVEERLAAVDPKKIPVPESDICTFSARTEHFHVNNKPSSSLFTSNTRPKALRELYEAAAIVAVRGLDSLRRDGSSMDMFLCTPVLGKRRRDQSLDIESRIPAVIEDLRRWTSTEALGDVTVPPDCMSRILGDTDDDAVDHKLPSPEEQVQAVALKFPAEIVAVDVSGRGFERMSMRRRSLLSGPECQETAVKRRSRLRRPRGKRRNTIAGTDQKEIRQAIGVETIDEDADGTISNIASRTQRSASTDILGSSKKESPTEKKSHFNTLKAWGMSRLKLISPKSSQQQQQQQQQQQEQPGTTAASTTRSETDLNQSRSTEERNIYEMVTSRRRKDKSHERKPSSSSSSGKSIASIPVSVPTTEKQPSVKLRESAVQRRERRKGSNRDDPPHSSSGNWSASSESGRASIGSETTTTTHQPRSTTTASIGTSSTSLSHVRRFKGRDTSASSSVTSEGTLTPDIIQDIAVVPFSDDGETSSVYSCDTEGYYTSFHVDSGLKTLREEETVPQSSSSTRTNDVSSDPTSPTVENEYELFGRGSTSTTTSSAGTVCTALLAPPPPERKSSLTVVAMVHGQNQNGDESPDSGHNTSSSPVESASSPACTGRSCSEFEYSESSDLEGCERIERIRSKTAINTSRIPSMCVITPPGSDDELTRESEQPIKISENRKSEIQAGGSVLMSATVGTSKMEVINGQDKNLYATVQVLPSPVSDKPTIGQASAKINPLSGVLGKLRGVLPGRKHVSKNQGNQEQGSADSGDYVTIADVRNNNDKRQEPATASNTAPAWSPVLYANSDIFKKDAEYVSLSELPKKPTSSLERKRQGARVTLDSEGKVVYTSDSLKRRKGAHSTFNPGPFVREGISPSPSPLLHRATPNVRAVTKSNDAVDGPTKLTPPTSPQLGKLIIRAARSPDRASSPDYVRTPTTVVGPTSPTTAHRQVRGAYVNMQEDEGKKASGTSADERDCTGCVGRLEAPFAHPGNTHLNDEASTIVATDGSPLLSANGTCQTAATGTVALAPSNKVLDLNKPKLSSNKPYIARSTVGAIVCDENHPPATGDDSLSAQEGCRSMNKTDALRTSSSRSTNLRLDFEKSALCLKSLRPTGNTPKLSRKLLVSDLDTPSFYRKLTKVDPRGDNKDLADVKDTERHINNCNSTDKDVAFESSSVLETCSDGNATRRSDSLREDRIEHKVKRSESYRMANSPIMFIRKFSSTAEKSSKISRTPSEELQEELLKESINYPETVSSPEPQNDLGFCADIAISVPITTVPKSPRPRATDIEPARVLKYSGNDTEIW